MLLLLFYHYKMRLQKNLFSDRNRFSGYKCYYNIPRSRTLLRVLYENITIYIHYYLPTTNPSLYFSAVISLTYKHAFKSSSFLFFILLVYLYHYYKITTTVIIDEPKTRHFSWIFRRYPACTHFSLTGVQCNYYR